MWDAGYQNEGFRENNVNEAWIHGNNVCPFCYTQEHEVKVVWNFIDRFLR